MTVEALPRLTTSGHPLETDPAHFGELRSATDLADVAEPLRERMREDGYLYLPGYLDRELVLQARRDITSMLADQGRLDPRFPPLEAVAKPAPPPRREGGRVDIARRSEAVRQVLYAGRMMALFRRFLGGEVRHFDYTWLRTVGHGRATPPHYDIVFMGRGTPNLYTAWTPMGDIPYELGGLMILEHSHRVERLRNSYGRLDVDSYCENRPNAALFTSGQRRWGGHLTKNAARLGDLLGGRWLTTEYRAGDVLIFGMYLVHASIDNQSDRIRISTDSRYQLASEPADERWIGEEPSKHTAASRRGLIC